jgi:hypothetical protein
VILDYFLDYKSPSLRVTGCESVDDASPVSCLFVMRQHAVDALERFRKPTLYPLSYEGLCL